jgi:hypothetical protein
LSSKSKRDSPRTSARNRLEKRKRLDEYPEYLQKGATIKKQILGI